MEVVEQGGQEAMRVEEVQETAAIDQLLLVTSQSEDVTADMSLRLSDCLTVRVSDFQTV